MQVPTRGVFGFWFWVLVLRAARKQNEREFATFVRFVRFVRLRDCEIARQSPAGSSASALQLCFLHHQQSLNNNLLVGPVDLTTSSLCRPLLVHVPLRRTIGTASPPSLKGGEAAQLAKDPASDDLYNYFCSHGAASGGRLLHRELASPRT